MRYRYYNLLNIPTAKKGRWAIVHKTEPPNKKLHLATIRTLWNGQTPPPERTVAYPFETRWHQLTEDGGVWMSDIPLEQYQHAVAVAPMRGHVLVGGLGLGVAATMLARKRTVESIVVVEKNKAVIDLVWPHLSAAVHRKAVIVHENLFRYLRAQRLQRLFTWAFYDIWTTDGEHTFHHTVIPLRKLSQIRVANVLCWNEDVMRGQLLRNLNARLDMMIHPVFIRPAQMSDDQIKALLLHDESIYQRWARPFWQRFYDNPDPAHPYWRHEAAAYAKSYGLEFP